VLWIATEEDASALRYKADWIKRGLDVENLDGTILYRFAADPRRRLTLDDLAEIIDVDGPLDSIVLDSLTGLRPRKVDGERVKWDLDNDAANEMCLSLRALTAEHQIALQICHHTGRDTTRGYRGATDWWASADVMLGLVPDARRTKVLVEKNRDGPRWTPQNRPLIDTSKPAISRGVRDRILFTSRLLPCASRFVLSSASSGVRI
jgi:hypothetical protein